MLPIGKDDALSVFLPPTGDPVELLPCAQEALELVVRC
jgi:hypothetical protein